jgi:GST-like protein
MVAAITLFAILIISVMFIRFAKEKVPYALQRYAAEMDRLFNVADRRLAETKFLAGDDYSIADIATFGWLRTHE